jgi:hypothetical protein
LVIEKIEWPACGKEVLYEVWLLNEKGKKETSISNKKDGKRRADVTDKGHQEKM